MYINLSRLRVYPLAIVMTVLAGSVFSPVYANEEPYQQDFVVTAYYSPLPNQCCYFRGSYEEELAFNGEGVKGADGTAVYPGMLAAPPSYPFGTIVDLGGIGVGTVHDRGGRIIEWDGDVHRVDVWMGSGEEGLARAMAWGVRRVKGTVYPVGTKAPGESIVFANFPADSASIASLVKSEPMEILPGSKADDASYAVRLLQQDLKELGYLDANPTGTFGPATKDALAAFQAAASLGGDGTSVDERTAAAIIASLDVLHGSTPDLAVLSPGDEGAQVRLAQQVLRYIGAYKGRTDGKFDDDMRAAVIEFQRGKKLIATEQSDGAGRIGPLTRQAVIDTWRAKQVARRTNTVVLKARVAKRVKDAGVPSGTLVQGSKGKPVKQLQVLLGRLGFFPAKEANANFGEKTKAALLDYQLDRKIVDSEDAHGAGVFGPATRQSLLADAIDAEWRKVRGSGL